MSLITTPSQAEAFVRSPAFTGVIDDSKHDGAPSFIVKDVPGHGKGVVANWTIVRGTELMKKNPVLFINDAIFDRFVHDDYLPLLHTGIQRLPEKTREIFMDLARQLKGDPVDDIIDTNSFNFNMFGDGELDITSYSVVTPEIAVS
jgi:hypothetical protein